MRTTGNWLTAALLALASAAACAPSVRSFDASPRALCAGDSALLSWQVRGTPYMAMRANGPRLGGTPTEGAVAVPDTVTLTLYARKGGKVSRPFARQVLEYPAEPTLVLLGRTALENGALVARFTVDPVQFGDRFAVGEVSTPSGRALQVSHAGRMAAVGPDSTGSAALAGTPVPGAWELRSPLGPGETDPRTLPDRLRIRVHARCTSAR